MSETNYDELHEECGIFGISCHLDAAAHTALGLHALQHRGQEAAGIVTYDGQDFHSHHAQGLVGENFNSAQVISGLKGNYAIGHVRYSTSGGNELRNIQPLFAELNFGGISLAHNGNLTNAVTVKTELIDKGCIFHSSMDTEIIMHLVAISQADGFVNKFIDALSQIEGAYALVALTADALIGVRDPFGIRPLSLGKVDDSFILASETCAFDIVGAEYIRDIEPGEIVIIRGDNISSLKPFAKHKQRFCVFEYVYFARPNSVVEGRNVYNVRKLIGEQLAKEAPIEADLVVPVPDSGVAAALGYSAYSKIPFELGIIRSHYIGRTFIEPTDQIRKLGVKLKHSPNEAVIKGKRIVLIDDSIVRGTTSKKIVSMLRDAGVKEIHMRIASPPTAFSCYYGVDTPDRKGLFAANHSVAEMAKLIGVDSLAFLSIDGLYRATGEAKRDLDNPQFCDACFTGNYPVDLTDMANEQLHSRL